jgi:hypothetical protein
MSNSLSRLGLGSFGCFDRLVFIHIIVIHRVFLRAFGAIFLRKQAPGLANFF